MIERPEAGTLDGDSTQTVTFSVPPSFIQAAGPGHCCLCGEKIFTGQKIRRMPDSWSPDSRRRHAHKHCIFAEVGRIKAKLARSAS